MSRADGCITASGLRFTTFAEASTSCLSTRLGSIAFCTLTTLTAFPFRAASISACVANLGVALRPAILPDVAYRGHLDNGTSEVLTALVAIVRFAKFPWNLQSLRQQGL